MVEQDVMDWDGDCARVCTVDAVHGVPAVVPEDHCYFGSPRVSEVGFAGGVGAWAEEQEIQKLSARLQALEADRESMWQAIMSMGAEKAQVVMLKEIAQHLCKEAAPLPAVSLKMQSPLQPVVSTQSKFVKRQPFFAKLFIVTGIKIVKEDRVDPCLEHLERLESMCNQLSRKAPEIHRIMIMLYRILLARQRADHCSSI